MSRVLVTGARGFLGRFVGPRLAARGFEVHAVTSGALPAGSDRERHGSGDAVWHRCDLLDGADVRSLVETVRPSHLLHLAWYTEHGRFYSAPENLTWVRASLELLDAFIAAGGRRAVVAGTCAEYDWSYGFLSEGSTPLAPATLYGAAKRALWGLFEALTERQALSGAWARIFFPYGPGQPPGTLVASVARSLLAAKPAATTHGRQLRDFLYVEDVADALAEIVASPVDGAVNVGSGRPIEIAELVYTVARSLGRPELVELGAIRAPENDPPLILADVRRLRDEVGWRPRVTIDEGVARTVDWWRLQNEAES